jgi:uncharacterized integral membrane protein
MPDFITLSCPSCGGKLQVTPDLERFACGYCGAEHVVRRGGGIVALEPITQGIKKVQEGVDRTASELAIKRLREEVPNLRNQRQSILNDPKYQVSNDPVMTMIFVGIIMVLIALTVILVGIINKSGGFVSGAQTVPIVVFALGLMAFLIGIILLKSGESNKVEKQQEQQTLLSRLDAQIASKEGELKHHEEIVSYFK